MLLLELGCSGSNCLCGGGPSTGEANINSCSPKKQVYDIAHIDKLLKEEKINPQFGMTIFEREGKPYFLYVSSNHNLVCASMTEPGHVVYSPVARFSAQNSHFLLDCFQDTVHLVDVKAKVYHRIALNKDLSLGHSSAIDLSAIVDLNDWYIHVNTNSRQLSYSYPELYLPYGLLKGKNFQDRQAVLKINTVSRSFERILDYPECYGNCDFYSNNTSVDANGSAVYALFSFSDDIQKLNTSSGSISQTQLPGSSGFTPFDRSKEKNLAYVRMYENTTEKNAGILLLKQGGHVAFKRMAKPSLNEPDRYQYYFFNSKDELQCSGVFAEDVFIPLARSFGNGIVLPDKKLSKLFYYELQ